jgi:hypothetical protein
MEIATKHHNSPSIDLFIHVPECTSDSLSKATTTRWTLSILYHFTSHPIRLLNADHTPALISSVHADPEMASLVAPMAHLFLIIFLKTPRQLIYHRQFQDRF